MACLGAAPSGLIVMDGIATTRMSWLVNTNWKASPRSILYVDPEGLARKALVRPDTSAVVLLNTDLWLKSINSEAVDIKGLCNGVVYIRYVISPLTKYSWCVAPEGPKAVAPM